MNRPRRDPRAERAAVTIGHRPLRIDRAHQGGTAPRPLTPEPGAAPLITIRNPTSLIFAVVEAAGGALSQQDRQVIGGARRLDPGNAAVVMITPHSPSHAGPAGADRVMLLPQTSADPASRAALLVQAITNHAPRHVIFAETEPGGDLARRVAAALDTPLFDNVESLTQHIAIRPNQARTHEYRAPPGRLITIAPDMIAPWQGPPREALPIDPPSTHPAHPPFIAIENLPVNPATIPLDQAPLVIAAGNGVTDFTAFRALATALGATPGASRVVCDAGHLPRAMQVGASGTILNADCYIALGIAGAPQHLQGLGRVDRIIAINTDLHAAMIARADLAIVADAQAVMQALLRHLP